MTLWRAQVTQQVCLVADGLVSGHWTLLDNMTVTAFIYGWSGICRRNLHTLYCRKPRRFPHSSCLFCSSSVLVLFSPLLHFLCLVFCIFFCLFLPFFFSFFFSPSSPSFPSVKSLMPRPFPQRIASHYIENCADHLPSDFPRTHGHRGHSGDVTTRRSPTSPSCPPHEQASKASLVSPSPRSSQPYVIFCFEQVRTSLVATEADRQHPLRDSKPPSDRSQIALRTRITTLSQHLTAIRLTIYLRASTGKKEAVRVTVISLSL